MSGFRAGVMVRVVNPDSEYFGTTGHIIGRNERDGNEQYWLVRFATHGASVLLVDEDIVVVNRRVRGAGAPATEPSDNL